MKNCCRLLFRLCLAFLFVLGAFTLAVAQEAGSGEEMKSVEDMFGDGLAEEDYYRADRMLITATKHKISVRKAPAIASVITADEMRNTLRYLQSYR